MQHLPSQSPVAPRKPQTSQRPSLAYDASAALWYTQVKRKKQGPFQESDLGALILEEKVKATDYVWTVGMLEWEAASEVEALRKYFSQLPPPIAISNTLQTTSNPSYGLNFFTRRAAQHFKSHA